MMRDILDSIQSKVIILKIDVEGYECKALQPEILQNQVGKFIPFIFMEFDSNSPHCSGAVDVLMSHGYSAFITIEARSGI